MLSKNIHGWVAPGFEAVREALIEAVHAEPDLEAQVAARHRGHAVVDLWTGSAADENALLGMYSATKGVAHLVVASLVQDGVLDLDASVSAYWPEFALGGKGHVLLRELLAHRAGVVGTAGGFSVDELADDRVVAERLARQVPYWRPGAESGYHALVVGALTGEVVRRATGHSVQDLFRDRIGDPFKLDMHFGVGADQAGRVRSALPVAPDAAGSADHGGSWTSPDSIAGVAFNRNRPGGPEVWELPNLDPVRRLGPASLGGFGTARALATLYSAAVVATEGHEAFLTAETAATFGQVQSIGYDLVLQSQKAWAVGFHAVAEQYPALAAGAFGHSGAGGQQAFVSPAQQLSYAFLRRRAGLPSATDAVHRRLVEALVVAAEPTRPVPHDH